MICDTVDIYKSTGEKFDRGSVVTFRKQKTIRGLFPWTTVAPLVRFIHAFFIDVCLPLGASAKRETILLTPDPLYSNL